MCKYEMDPTSIVEDTELTWFCPQTDRQMDKVKPVYPPFNFVTMGGVSKARLGRVTSLGQPKSVYKRDIERCLFEFWVEMAKWQGQWPVSNTSWCVFGANLTIVIWTHYKLQCKPNISRSCISRNRIYRGRMLDPIFWPPISRTWRPRVRFFANSR